MQDESSKKKDIKKISITFWEIAPKEPAVDYS